MSQQENAPRLNPWLVGVSTVVFAVGMANNIYLPTTDINIIIRWTGVLALGVLIGHFWWVLKSRNR